MSEEKKMCRRCEMNAELCRSLTLCRTFKGYLCRRRREYYTANALITLTAEEETESNKPRAWLYRDNTVHYPGCIFRILKYSFLHHYNSNSNIVQEEDDEEGEVGFQCPVGGELELKQYPVLLFEKVLDCCDVSHCCDRLLITQSSGRDTLIMALNQQERARVMNGDDHDSLRVRATDSSRGILYDMRLERKRDALALSNVGSLVLFNGLKIGDTVRGWGYRLGPSPDEEFRLEITPFKNTI